MTTVLLARHGESDWNRDERWQGHTDRPLTALGRTQAAALGRMLAGVRLDAVYASDLERAWATAEIAAKTAAGAPVEVRRLRELREVDVGEWSGLTRAEVSSRFPAGFGRWRTGQLGWERGESYEQMADRVLASIRGIASRHPDGRVLVVSHGGSIRAVKAHALGMAFGAFRRAYPVEPNAVLSVVAVENGTFRLTGMAKGSR